jgi:hypothetical protein
MIKVFCDVCGKPLERNMVDERLIVESGEFKAEVLIEKNGTSNEGDLCLDCLLKMLNQKPKRKYVRKQVKEEI